MPAPPVPPAPLGIDSPAIDTQTPDQLLATIAHLQSLLLSQATGPTTPEAPIAPAPQGLASPDPNVTIPPPGIVPVVLPGIPPVAHALPVAQMPTVAQAPIAAQVPPISPYLAAVLAPTLRVAASGATTTPVPVVTTPRVPPPVPPSIPASVSFALGANPPAGPVPHTTPQKWYVVVVGRNQGDTGVYNNWGLVGPMVTGVPGAIFKGGFKTRAEAESYLANAVAIPVAPTASRRPKWYAISVGRDPEDRGVYDSWPDVASRVVGVDGAVYQGGFDTRNEAEVFLARLPGPPPSFATQAATAPVPPPLGTGGQQSWTTPVAPSANQYHPGTPQAPLGPAPGPYGHTPTGYASPYGASPGPPSPYGTQVPPAHPQAYAAPQRAPPSPYGPHYGQSPGNQGMGQTFAPPPGSGSLPNPGAPPHTWTLPQRLVGPDPSIGKKGELWTAKAGEDLSMLQAWAPPGLTLERQVQYGDQALDAVGLPGTSSQGSDDFDLARLSDAFVMMASGRNSSSGGLLQGNVDTTFKSEKRTTLGSIKSLEDLEHRVQALTSNQHLVMENVETNLKIVLMGGGYTAHDAGLLAHDSPFLRISGDSQSAYLGLHLHLLGVGLQSGWEHLKTELSYHVRKLKEIRALHQTRLQVVAHNYCYLRDLQNARWQTFGIQDLRIREIQSNLAFLSPGYLPTVPRGPAASPAPAPAPAGGRVHFCSHCKTSLHPGNKASCFWKAWASSEAKKAGATAVRRLGEAPISIGADGIPEV
jgi:hypothetical protein